MSAAIHAPATAAMLDAAQRFAPEHLRPILDVVREFNVGALIVPQSVEPFRLPRGEKRPAIYIIGDDLEASRGPSGFHLPSLRRAIRGCVGFAVIAGEPPTQMYAAAAAMAATGRNVMIVETQPEHQIQWVELIQKLAPGRPLMWSTVKGGSA